MNNDKLRAGIYSMAAVYLLYTAMQLYKEVGNVIAAAFFVIAAIGILVFAFKIAKKVTDEEKRIAEEKEEEEIKAD
ncbi:MAG: hypothetical protein IKW08_03650 [Roseburia sp.]|nr:hypothetical protein [Roseburia sp.]